MQIQSMLRRSWVVAAVAILIVPAAVLFGGGSPVTMSPGTCTDSSQQNGISWNSPGSATSTDDSYASVGFPQSGDISNYLVCTNFGFSIPNGAIIDSIEASIERHAEVQNTLVGGISASGGFANAVTDQHVYLVKSGVIQDGFDDNASGNIWPSTDASQPYGGPVTDLWGNTWTPSDINSSGFGVALSAIGVSSTFIVSGGSAAPRVSGPSSQSSQSVTRSARVRTEGVSAQGIPDVIAFVDLMQITVYFTEPSTSTPTATATATPTSTSTATATATPTTTSTGTATATPTATSKRTTATRIPGPSQTRTSQAPRTTATPRPGSGLADEGWRAAPSRYSLPIPW